MHALSAVHSMSILLHIIKMRDVYCYFFVDIYRYALQYKLKIGLHTIVLPEKGNIKTNQITYPKSNTKYTIY